MLKMEYFNLRLLKGMLRSKQVIYPAEDSTILYTLQMCGVASNCLQNVLPPGAVMPQATPNASISTCKSEDHCLYQ